MKKKLLKLPEDVLTSVAANFSITGTHKEKAEQLADYLKNYNLSYADLVSRFNLNSLIK